MRIGDLFDVRKGRRFPPLGKQHFLPGGVVDVIIRDHVERYSHLSSALHAPEQGPQQLPHEEHMARLPVPLAVREVDQPVVVGVYGAAVWAADSLGRSGSPRTAEG